MDYRIEPALITRIVPAPNDESIALVRRFRSVFAAYKKAEPEAAERVPDSISLEGYILGRFVIEVLARMPGELTLGGDLANDGPALLRPSPHVGVV